MAMTLRLSDAGEELLEKLAEQTHQSKTAVVESALRQMAERSDHRTRVRAAFDRVDQRDADLLDRLSR
jgi:predicted transcriptional regulator